MPRIRRGNDQPERDPEILAAKVRLLFETRRKPSGEKYTYQEVEATKNISNGWISKLANRGASSPGLWSLKDLTDFFDVDPSYWFDPPGTLPKPKSSLMQQGQLLVTRPASSHLGDDEDLLPAEQKAVEEFKAFVRQRRGNGSSAD